MDVLWRGDREWRRFCGAPPSVAATSGDRHWLNRTKSLSVCRPWNHIVLVWQSSARMLQQFGPPLERLSTRPRGGFFGSTLRKKYSWSSRGPAFESVRTKLS